MLQNSKAFSSFAVNDLDKAREFYGNTLDLGVKTHEMGFLQVSLAGNQDLMIYGKADFQPAGFTVLNFPVEDIDQAVTHLREKGVRFEEYKGDMATDEKGIYRPDKGRGMAWFKDPAGNILCVLKM